MDSEVVAMMAQIAKQQAQALHTDFCVFEPVEFAEKLVKICINWLFLGRNFNFCKGIWIIISVKGIIVSPEKISGDT